MELTGGQIEILKKMMASSALKGNLANAALVLDCAGRTVAASESLVNTNCDATAHAERLLVEMVCKEKKSSSGKGSSATPGLAMVTVCEPCLMCLAACALAEYKTIAYIIPAAKYIDKIPWLSENVQVDKQEIARTFINPVELSCLNQYEEEFSKIFESAMSRFLK
ncbi:MAG: hypothetical protein WCX69_01590 [Candidatus Paceibacterota bacterium]